MNDSGTGERTEVSWEMKLRQEHRRTSNPEWSEKGRSIRLNKQESVVTYEENVNTEVGTTSLLEEDTKRREDDSEAGI